MCTINITFEVPESKHIDIEALKQKVNTYVKQLIANQEDDIVLTDDTELQAQKEKEAFLYTSRINASKMFAKYL